MGGPLGDGRLRWALAIGLLLAHVALTLGLSSGLERDELETMLFAQGWAWGYDVEQPPLYNWLQMALFEVTGPSLAASILLRWSVIALGLLALYAAVRRMAGADAALAAGAVAGAAGTSLFGFEAARHFTHSHMLLTAMAALWWAVAAVVARPTAARYLLVGLALTAAVLSKYTVVVFVAGLLAGVVADPVTRARLLDRRLALVALPPLLVLPGHLWWRLHQPDSDLLARVSTLTEAAGDPGWVLRLTEVARAVVADPVVAMLPPLGVMLVFLVPWGRRSSPVADPPRGPRWSRVLAVAVAVSMLLTLAVVLGAGGERLRYHYMMPAAMLLPALGLLWLHERGVATRLAPWRRRVAGMGLAGLAVLLTAATALDRLWIAPAHCDRCPTLLPAAAAAERVAAAGFRDGTIVAASLDWGANLRPAFPDARLLARRTPAWTPPRPPGTGACLILLARAEAAAVQAGTFDPAPVTATLTGMLGTAPPPDWAARIVVHDLPLTRGPVGRTVPFGFALLPDGSGSCR